MDGFGCLAYFGTLPVCPNEQWVTSFMGYHRLVYALGNAELEARLLRVV